MKYFLTILLFIITQNSYAQLDNVHYLQPLASPNTSGGLTQEFLYLSTPSISNITVKITYPNETTSPRLMVGNSTGGNEVEITNGIVTLSNSNPVRIRFLGSSGTTSLTPGTSYSPITPSMSYAGRVIGSNEGVGLILKSDQTFYANYRGRSEYQAGSMLAKGKSALGNHFFWVGLPVQLTPSTLSVNNVLSIMSTENNNSVTIKGYDSGLTFLKGSNSETWTSGASYTITLNKGESFIFVVNANSTEAQKTGWLGTEITSTKNIVATVAGLMQQGNTQGQRDISFDQIIPVNQLGKLYVPMQGNGTNGMERVIVVATEGDTRITVDGSYITTINKGDYYIVPGSHYGDGYRYMKVETSKNSYVTQKLFGTDEGTTSNFMLLPPLTCNGQTTIDNIPNVLRIGSTNYTTNSRLYLLARTMMLSSTKVYVDGLEKTPIASRTYTVAPDWTMMVYTLSHGNVKVVSNGTIQGQILGASGDAGYGNYFAGFGVAPPMSVEVDFKRFDNVCTGDTGSTLLKPLNNYSVGTIVWYKDGNVIPGATSGTYRIPETDTEPATYKMILTLPDGCSYYTETIQSVVCPCTKQPNLNPGESYPGIVGISTTDNADSNWPHNVNNAFLTLKSNDKGLVISNNASPETTISNPVLGMIVYDTDDNCYKLYNGNEWKCLRQKCYDYDY